MAKENIIDKAVNNVKKDSYPGWRTMSGSARHNAKQDKIMEHYHEHLEGLKKTNPAEHKHITTHISSKRYKGCEYCK